MKIIIHPKIIAKIAARGITGSDVDECFRNATAGAIIDRRIAFEHLVCREQVC